MKKVIGRKEEISIPKWGLVNVPAKIDTGAYTSSIHCEFAEIRVEGGEKTLYFKLLGPGYHENNDKLIGTRKFARRKVKNSFGQVETRFMVRCTVLVFGEKIRTDFTLANRGNMKNPILLGRKLLRGHFLVDVSSTNLASKNQSE